MQPDVIGLVHVSRNHETFHRRENTVPSPKFQPSTYSIHKVKVFRAMGSAGARPYCRDGFEVTDAIGSIEVVGSKTDGVPTRLRIVFSTAKPLPAPQFHASDKEAVGSLALPAAMFGTYLALLQAPRAFFRTGGDGQQNALASEKRMLEVLA